jgi:hypothetical protein
MGLFLGMISSFVWPVKDDLGARLQAHTACPVDVVKEHHWFIHLEHPDKSFVAKHNINLGHGVQLCA